MAPIVRNPRNEPATRASMLGAGRIVLGISILGFGFVGLLYADFLSSLQPVPAWLPAYPVVAVVNGIVLAVAGVAILADRMTSRASLAIVVFFLSCIALLHVPSAFTQPALLRSPWWIRTFESVALAGGAITLAGLRNTPARNRWIRNGRIAFGLSIPVFGVLHLVYAEPTASLIPTWYPWPLFLAYVTGMVQVVGGLAIAVGVWPRTTAILAGAMYGAWALTLHIPRVWCRLQGPCEFLDVPGGLEASRGEITSLFVVIGMCGAAWLVAAGAHLPPRHLRERGRLLVELPPVVPAAHSDPGISNRVRWSLPQLRANSTSGRTDWP